MENILTWDNDFNDRHNLNLLLVQSAQENKFSRTFTQADGFTNESLGYDGITNAIGDVLVERDKNQQRLASFLARARYNFLGRYTIEAQVVVITNP